MSACKEEEAHGDIQIQPREELVGWQMSPDRVGNKCGQPLVTNRPQCVLIPFVDLVASV